MTFSSESSNRNLKHARLCLVLVACISTLLLACESPRQKGEEKHYELKGKVVSVDRARSQVVIDHKDIPGLMEGMVMPFTLKDEYALQEIAGGDEIQATLVVTDRGFWLENPIVTKAVPNQGGATDTSTSREPQAGAEVPDFALVNQDGKGIRLKQYRGRALLLTFIYTRCPLPEYCSLMSSNFAEVNREMEKNPAMLKKTHLLSVSIDPAYDTPKVLRSYGAAYTEKYADETFEHWEFATGQADEVKRMTQFFGLEYFGENDQIIHSLRTALISPEGRLLKIYRGNEWKPAEVLQDLRNLPAMQS